MTERFNELNIAQINNDILDEEDLNVSPAATPRMTVVATPRDQAFPEENILAEIEEYDGKEEIFGTDNNGNKTLRAAKFERIVKWVAFEEPSLFLFFFCFYINVKFESLTYIFFFLLF